MAKKKIIKPRLRQSKMAEAKTKAEDYTNYLRGGVNKLLRPLCVGDFFRSMTEFGVGRLTSAKKNTLAYFDIDNLAIVVRLHVAGYYRFSIAISESFYSLSEEERDLFIKGKIEILLAGSQPGYKLSPWLVSAAKTKAIIIELLAEKILEGYGVSDLDVQTLIKPRSDGLTEFWVVISPNTNLAGRVDLLAMQNRLREETQIDHIGLMGDPTFSVPLFHVARWFTTKWKNNLVADLTSILDGRCACRVHVEECIVHVFLTTDIMPTKGQCGRISAILASKEKNNPQKFVAVIRYNEQEKLDLVINSSYELSSRRLVFSNPADVFKI